LSGVRDFFGETASNTPVACETAGVVEVSANFTKFFWGIFILYLISLCTSVLTCLGRIDACKCIGACGACISIITSLVSFVWFFIGTSWRWSGPGAVCAGTYLEPGQNTDLSESGAAYALKSGMALQVLLVLFYVGLGLCVCCGVFVCFAMICCAATVGA